MVQSRRNERLFSFLLIIALYALAFCASVFVFRSLVGMPVLLATLTADVAATLVVWLGGVVLKNSSAYDPYWSVAPVVIAIIWALSGGDLRLADILFLALLAVWGVRLTANWARRFDGFRHEDWRYVHYRTQMPKLWLVINLFGINLMPTVLVFLGMIPVFVGINSPRPANLLTAAGFALGAAAICLEHMADSQMDAYHRQPQSKSPVMDGGLWRWCRHPNYLGEILFWWGLWLMQASLTPQIWTLAGAALITVLFVFVSIPMMERHVLEKRPDYIQYMKQVPMLLPLHRKEASADTAHPPLN